MTISGKYELPLRIWAEEVKLFAIDFIHYRQYRPRSGDVLLVRLRLRMIGSQIMPSNAIKIISWKPSWQRLCVIALQRELLHMQILCAAIGRQNGGNLAERSGVVHSP